MKFPLDMKIVRRALEVARDLYEKGNTSESNFILREVFAALSDTWWYESALRDWFTGWEPTARIVTTPKLDIAGALRPVAVHLMEAGLRTRAARLLGAMSGVSPVDLSEYSRELRSIRTRTSAIGRMEPEVVRPLEVNGLRMLEIGLPQGVSVLSSLYRFAEPRASLSSEIHDYLRFLPNRRPAWLAQQEVNTVANAAYDFHFSGRSESAVRLGMLLTSASAEYISDPLRVERLWEELADDAGIPLRTARGQMVGAVDVGLKLNKIGYAAEGANVFLDSLDLKEDSPKWERLWQVVDRDVLSSTVRPPSRAGSRARGIYSSITRASPTAGGPGSTQVASPREPQSGGSSSARPQMSEESAPPRPPEGSKDSGTAPCPPAFFFIFEGDARGQEVLLGADVDLVFHYECPDPHALATFEGKQLEKLRGKTVDLEITVHPIGLTLRKGSVVRQIAHFTEGKLQEPLPRFRLTAPDTKPEDCGLYVIFSIKGAILYDFFVHVELVEELSGEVRPAPPIDLDLEELTNCQVEERDLLVMISGRSKWEAYFVSPKEPSEPVPVGLDESSLAVTLTAELKPLQLAADHSVWVQLTKDLQLPPGTEKSAHSCVEKVMSFGYSLYNALSKDPGLKQILDRVESLRPGAKLTIWTTSFFVPWEILYPKEFNYEYPEDKKKANFDPALFWGNRFQIECLLSSKPGDPHYPADRRQRGRLGITIGLNTAIDKKVPAEAKFKPIEFQTAYSKGLGDTGDLCDTAVQIKKVFQERDYPSTFIYLYCHGQASNPFIGTPELLQFADFEIRQSFVTDDIYAHWPIIFLNSCSAGAVSPLLFSSFLTKFRTKQAFGLVAPAFPIPILFAAGFGKKVIDKYISGVPIGRALWDLRRELLKQENPLGLFYTLQCPMDVTAPGVRK